MLPQIQNSEAFSRRRNEHFHHLTAMSMNHFGPNEASIVAGILYKNKFYAFGLNNYKTHPFQKKYGRTEYHICLHAEVSAIAEAIKHLTPDELVKSELIVIRTKWVDKYRSYRIFGTAKPCSGCEKCIKDHHIKKVWYSTDDQKINIL